MRVLAVDGVPCPGVEIQEKPDDVAEEYNIPKDEATKLWNSGVALLGSGLEKNKGGK
jgi:hypothetical protein